MECKQALKRYRCAPIPLYGNQVPSCFAIPPLTELLRKAMPMHYLSGMQS